ncbi:acetylxylan esterase, partial [Thermanaerothrix sp.]|uniref:acetylxylan esterase n=1 Tax=Thermanaerothrix sp. TaxID=2972675 RepID=UPI003A0FFE3E
MPLTFDLPLEQLKAYQGINPRPSDFDAFWENSLAELSSIDPKVELIPAEFQA